MNSIRREKIRAYLEERQVATLEELSALLPEISLMTLHRDLSYLQEQGLVTKVRGGARYNEGGPLEPAFGARAVINREAKERIALKAAALLEGVGSLFLDAGTTSMALARHLPDSPVNVVTTGPNIALELARGAGFSITLCGGFLNKSNLTLSGPAALETIAGINIDTAVLVASGFSSEAGFTCGQESEARIKQAVIRKARRVLVAMDGAKLDRLLPYTFGSLRDIHCLITDLPPDSLPEELRRAAETAGVQLV